MALLFFIYFSLTKCLYFQGWQVIEIAPYIIVTPAFNEAEYIEQTIKSVLSLTVLPEKWVIVDDSSSDETGNIIKQYAREYDFIQYHHRKKPKETGRTGIFRKYCFCHHGGV